MPSAIYKKATRAMDNLPDEKLKVVIDFIGYLKSKDKIPNGLTLETFRKTDSGKKLVRYKDAADMFRKLGI